MSAEAPMSPIRGGVTRAAGRSSVAVGLAWPGLGAFQPSAGAVSFCRAPLGHGGRD